MDERQRFIAPPVGWMLTWVVIVGVMTAVSLYIFPLGCAIGDNVEEGSHWDRVCDDIGLWYWGGVLAAVTSATIGAVLAGRDNRLDRFVWGISVGLMLGASPWLLLGDPAGNFDGLIELGTG